MSQAEQPISSISPLSAAVADLREDDAFEIVRQRIEQGDDPLQIIDECQVGMRIVGDWYAQQRYYLSALIVAGDILRQIMDIVLPLIEGRLSRQSQGRIMVGTVQGDIHDLGKDIFLMLLRSRGFTVLDLGVDVAPETFVEQARAFNPHAIGLSGLILAARSGMRETVKALHAMMAEDGTTIPIILGGHVDEQVCRNVGADLWTTDAVIGTRLCQQIMLNARTNTP